MAANASDLVRNATPNFATTLANSMLISDTSLSISSGTGLPTATGITLVIDATNSAGTYTPTVMEVVTGTLSGTTLSNLKRGLDGTTQQGHASGANVVMWITANLWNDFQTAFLLGHSQLTGAHLPSLPLTTPEITTSINDANGNKSIGISATGSAVNYLQAVNSATNNATQIQALGTDNNISLNLVPKGTGALQLSGTALTGLTGAWTSYIPTWTNLTVGNGTNASSYIQIGKTVIVELSFTLGSTSSVGSSAYFTLPVTSIAYAADASFGLLAAVHSGSGYQVVPTYKDTTHANLRASASSGNGILNQGTSSTVPFTWASTDLIDGIFMYQAA